MLVTTAHSMWPAVWPNTVQAVSYAQVGDFFKMLVQREESGYAACEFCRTVNSHDAVRCQTCGGVLTPPSEEDTGAETAKPNRQSSSDARALRSVLGMVLVPPLILFASFAAWHQVKFENTDLAVHAGTSAKPAGGEAIHFGTIGSSQVKLVTELLAGKKTSGSSERESIALPPAAEVQAQILEPNEIGRASVGGPSAPRTVKSSTSRPRDAAAVSGRQQQDVLASCNGLTFLARAVCVNNRCAEPKAARASQCREAVRQRRIDEARRNPILMG